MAWVYLLLAGALEIVWALSLKKTEGFTRIYPSLLTIAAMIVSFYLLGRAVKELPISTAYAVWTGIGAAGTAAVGMLWMGEAVSLPKILFLLLILAGTLGLKISHG